MVCGVGWDGMWGGAVGGEVRCCGVWGGVG